MTDAATLSAPLLLAFLLASLVLAATPGPGVVYIVTRTLAQGRRAGLASVAGVALGNLGNAMGAALGLAALFAVSSLAFTVVKFAGAAYLVYLGLRAFWAPASTMGAEASDATPWRRIFRDGFAVALLNPKTALFFAAFLPQFIHPGPSAMLQSIGLGAVFVAVAGITDSLYVLGANWVAPRLRGMRGGSRIGRWATATTYVGLGLYTALAGSRGTAEATTAPDPQAYWFSRICRMTPVAMAAST